MSLIGKGFIAMIDINLPIHNVTSFFSGLIKTISWLVCKGCLYMNRRIDFVKRVGYFLSARGKKSNSNKGHRKQNQLKQGNNTQEDEKQESKERQEKSKEEQ